MCDEDKTIELIVDEENGNINIKIEPWGIWNTFSDVDREMLLEDSAYWYIIARSLKYQLGKGVSTPNFYSSIHKLREMILTDSEFVSNMVVTFIKQLLELWAQAEQGERAARNAYYKLWRWVTDSVHASNRPTFKSPYDIEQEEQGEYLRISSKEVKADILEKFGKLLDKVKV